MNETKKKNRFKKRLAWSLGILLTLFIAIWIILPIWLESYVEKNDRSWINRDIEIEDITFNPIQLGLTLHQIGITEKESSSLFVFCQSLDIDANLWALFSKKIQLEHFWADSLSVSIIEQETTLNIDDLIQLSTSEENPEEGSSSNWTFEAFNSKLQNSHFVFRNKSIDSKFEFDSIYIDLPAFKGVDSLLNTSISCTQLSGGKLDIDISYNPLDQTFQSVNHLNEWSLIDLKPYVEQSLYISSIGADLNCALNINGQVSDKRTITSSGTISIDKAHLANIKKDTLIQFSSLALDIEQLNTEQKTYDFNTFFLRDAYLDFEYLPAGDNFSEMIVPIPDSLIRVAELQINTSNYYTSPFEYLALYIYDLTKDYIFKSYTADTIGIVNFNLDFEDFTLEDAFAMELTDTYISAHDINSAQQNVRFDFEGNLNTTGKLQGDLIVDRLGIQNMDVDFEIDGLFLTRLSPYSRFYTAHPFMDGAISMKSTNHIQDYYLKSTTNIFIEDIQVGKKQKTKNGGSLPMRLAVGIMKDLDGNIDLELPIEGPVDDPQYKMGKIILQVLKNLIVKTVSAPFRWIANGLNINEDDLKTIHFDALQTELDKKQIKNLQSIGKVIKERPDFLVEMNYAYNWEHQKDAIAVLKSKLAFLDTFPELLAEEKSEQWNNEEKANYISNTDSAFLFFLQERIEAYDPKESIAENTRKLYGEENLNLELDSILSEQKRQIKDYLFNELQIDSLAYRFMDVSNIDSLSINQNHPVIQLGVKMREDDSSSSTKSESQNL